MQNRAIKAIIATLTSILVVGCNSITAKGQETVKRDNIDSINSISCVSDGIMNSLIDSVQAVNKLIALNEHLHRWDNVEIYFTRTQKDYDKLTEVLEHRDGKIIIEVIEATVLDDDGNGSDQFGFYVKYDSTRFSKGDKVQSVFVYNPDTNYTDDFLYRVDALIE